MTEANLEHLSLTFKDFRLNIKDFQEYLNSVECPSKIMVPNYPLPKQDRLNFLKPGSKEVVSRQVHIHEHLPPMFPLLEDNNEEIVSHVENTEIDKTIQILDVDSKKKPRIVIGQAVRELSSVMMTTSGFLSPAREGKLPESRAPVIAMEPSVSPTESFKKPAKLKKLFKMRREFFKQFNDHESHKSAMKIKKRKVKSRVGVAAKNYMIVTHPNKIVTRDVIQKALSEEAVLQTKVIPPPQLPLSCAIMKDEPYVEKLSTKPSKRKINILRKISVKNKPLSIFKEEDVKTHDENLLAIVPKVEILNTFPNDLTIKPIIPMPVLESTFKRKVNLLRKPSIKNKKNDNFLFNMESKQKNTMEHFNLDDNFQLKCTPSSNLSIEPVNLVLPSDNLKKRTANEFKNVFSKSKFNKISNKEIHKKISTDVTANIMKDVGLHHNFCRDLIIEPIVTPSPAEKPTKLESYYNTQKTDSTFTQTAVHSGTSKVETPRDVKLRSPKHFPASKFDFEQNLPKIFDSTPTIPQSTIPSMHFPFFNPFAGPGLIPPPLINPLFPHLPIPPLGLPTFGQLPMPVPAAHPNPHAKLTSNSDIPPTKQQRLSKIPHVETSDNNILPEPEKESELTDAKPRKKKRKRDKHKSEKKRRDKSDAKKLKRESKLNPIISEPVPSIRREINLDISSYSNGQTKSKTESTPSEANLSRREGSPELAKFSALITGQPKQKTASSVKHIDVGVNPAKRGRGRPRIHPVTQPQQEIWTCPVCGNEDNGNPMICCDGCNTWYHWVCVGIQIPPEASEDWYCRHCINNKVEYLENEGIHRQKGKERKW